MSRARVDLRVGSGVALLGAGLALACGSRTSIEACAWNDCAATAGTSTSGGSGNGSGGRPSSSAGAFGRGGSGGTSGNSGSSFGGSAGAPLGGGAAAGQAGAAGAGGAFSEAPVVLLLLDGSTSMYDSQVWSPTYEALTGPGGPLDVYQDRVRLGFASYRGTAQTTEDDPACAQITSVPFALENDAAIRQTYGALGDLPRWPPFETPTGHALTRVTESLLGEPTKAARLILLISDGAPDTCLTTNPQCGQDRAVFAVQRAFAAGIETRAIGIGFGNDYPGCTPDTARCGSDHFQDIANAGRGLPVVAPPAGYSSLPCAAETNGQLLAKYSMQGGAAPYYWTMSPAEVAGAVSAILREVVGR